MFCSNCGNKLNENDQFCNKCGQAILKNKGVMVNNANNSTNINNDDEKKANILSAISLIVGFGMDAVITILATFLPKARDVLRSFGITGSLPILGLVIMIVARVKYPNNKFAKIVMWIYIVGFVITIVAILAIFATCITSCKDFPA